MTSQEFRKSQFRDQLHAFLQSDCGRHMIDLLEKKPSILPVYSGIHQNDSVVARLYAYDAGNNNCLEKLKDLAEPWVETSAMAEASMRPEWEDYLPKELVEAMKKQMNQAKQG